MECLMDRFIDRLTAVFWVVLIEGAARCGRVDAVFEGLK